MLPLEVKSIGYAFDHKAILDDVSLHVAPGEIVALSGASGSGKTTLLRLIAGFLSVQRGEIWTSGTCVSSSGHHVDPADRSIGMVFQDTALFPHLTVRKNVEFGSRSKGEAQRERYGKLIEMLHLEGLEQRYPHELSGGQQQRVGLARALYSSPSLLLLDEAFAGLDRALKRSLLPELRRILKTLGTSALMVSHEAEEAIRMADRVVVLDRGSIVQEGSPGELARSPKNLVVAEYFAHTVCPICHDDEVKKKLRDVGLMRRFRRPEPKESV